MLIPVHMYLSMGLKKITPVLSNKIQLIVHHAIAVFTQLLTCVIVTFLSSEIFSSHIFD